MADKHLPVSYDIMPLGIPSMDERTFGKTPRGRRPEKMVEKKNKGFHMEDLCWKDYAQHCPEKFTPISATQCVAKQNDLLNLCGGKVLSVDSSFSFAEKRQIAAACGVRWPCGDCSNGHWVGWEENIGPFLGCPENWVLNETSGECTPSNRYAGPCKSPVNFNLFSHDHLEQWMIRYE